MLRLRLRLGAQHEIADGLLLQPDGVAALDKERPTGRVVLDQPPLLPALAGDDPRAVQRVLRQVRLLTGRGRSDHWWGVRLLMGEGERSGS